jgi:hypothetical protein
MSDALRTLREHDRIVLARPRLRLDVRPFAGTWHKTNPAPQWIDRLVIQVKDGAEGDGLRVRIFGSQPPSPADWGEACAEALYASAIDASAGGAFVASYGFAAFDVEVEANLNLGLLIVATFVRWKRDGGADRFTREFFYRSAS